MVLGGAIGDGWGRPFEGGAPREGVPVPDEFAISDDTQLTLATCEAIIDAGRVDPAKIAERFVAWFRAGRLHGLGASTLKALRDLDTGVHWALTGAKGERSAGNGAAMRIAPVGFLLDMDDDRARQIIRDVCRITHHHDEAYVGALAVALAIQFVRQPNCEPSNLLVEIAGKLPDSIVRDRMVRLTGLNEDVSPAEAGQSWGNSGFVAESVPLAILATRSIHRRPFTEILQRAIEAGGDTDTIASIAGQIAGSALGVSALPQDLIVRLRDHEQILEIAESFARTAVSET
jgi:ADP-ribosylglycohydrolase